MLKKLLYFSLFICFLALIAGGVVGLWGYNYVTRDLPNFHNVEEYRPQAVTSVLADDGTVVGEFYEEKRYPVKLADVPEMVRHCFLAAEDATFYKHPGIDPMGIVRAAVKDLRTGSASQGGSTITQQVVKNMLLTPEKKFIRKVKEAILSYRLEERLSKDDILEIYLNQIFFGNGAYGIRAASRAYFHKELAQLSLGEAAMLAALPKAPTRYSPLVSYSRAKRRQQYVLEQMVKAGFATRVNAEVAAKEEIKVYPATSQNIFYAPYYVEEVRKVLADRWKDLDIDHDGLTIHTALNLKAEEFGMKAIHKGLREVDKRRGWRGPIDSIANASVELFVKRHGSVSADDLKPDETYRALVTEVYPAKKTAHVSLGKAEGTVDLGAAGWAKRKLGKLDAVSWTPPEAILKPGDVIEVSLAEPKVETPVSKKKNVPPPPPPEIQRDQFALDQTPDLEAALTLVDPFSGKVLTTIGGYSYQRSVFNRVTQSSRQPGSSFKPVVYLAAIDAFNYTPSTIVHDEPHTFKIGDQLWTPGNFDGKFMGAIPLQVALEHSRNLVSAEIVSRIGVDAVIQYARKLGITSKIGRNLSIALGTSEVTLLELARAYGVFAAKGVLFPSTFVTKIEDRSGRVLYDYDQERLNAAQQVIDPNSAFIMAHMMEGVVQRGTGYKVKELGRPTAGKTGTSNNETDAWFVGYTPSWVCGVWAGFDVKKEIGPKETGGMVSAPIFLYFMKDFLAEQDKVTYQKMVDEAKADATRLGIDYVPPEPLQPLDFSPPEGVDPYWVNENTGQLAEQGSPGSILEYFKKGTEPSQSNDTEDTNSYLESPDL